MSSVDTALPINLPPGPRAPRAIQGATYLAGRRRALHRTWERYGRAFSLNVPLLGEAVVISDPDLARQLFAAGPEVAGNVEPNLGRILGPGSLFALDGDPHRRHRKILSPPLHGRRMRGYESLIEEEYRREADRWAENHEFPILPSTMRITLNIILRAVFGADGDELEELRVLMPKIVTLGSRLAQFSTATLRRGRFSPWVRYRGLRDRYDSLIRTLIGRALADPDLEERADILALLLRARYEDGESMAHEDIADELLALLTAGHETTANTLAWVVERLRRHPEVLARLVAELDTGDLGFLQQTIWEVQRIRPVIAGVARQVKISRMQLGEWVIPKDRRIIVAFGLMHQDPSVYPDPLSFDPGRFHDRKPDFTAWLPFGGGNRRCIGAEFANLEMRIVLRALLRDFELLPTAERDERWRDRGVAFAPDRGGRVALRRREQRGSAMS
ncbi:cytochrome P450 [Nocardia sp. BSTN01]|uniref:cytochrome P450 n=1 Tax=Nocardia sp. BSTN01 TaxID=2783665 RepID=UPI001890494D|nr:cytochrome P450 [Nocardia sp. BSTN01]MBF5000505.1 cytochrome P450 [Nocardia sp. BSTN01]